MRIVHSLPLRTAQPMQNDPRGLPVPPTDEEQQVTLSTMQEVLVIWHSAQIFAHHLTLSSKPDL